MLDNQSGYRRYVNGFTVDNDNGATARRLASHPSMAGYYVADECGDASFGTDLVPETQEHHATLKGYDPAAVNLAVLIARGYRHPRFWTSPPNGDPKASAAPTADLFGTDPYPMFGPEPPGRYQHFYVPDYVARLRDEVPRDRPILGVMQFFAFGQLALPRLFRLDVVPQPPVPFNFKFTWKPAVFTGAHLLIIIVVPAVAVALTAFFRRSRVGIAVRASAESADRAALLGIPVKRLGAPRITVGYSPPQEGEARITPEKILAALS